MWSKNDNVEKMWSKNDNVIQALGNPFPKIMDL